MAVNRHYEKDGRVYRIYESVSDMVDEANQPDAHRQERYSEFTTSFIGRDIKTWFAARSACSSIWRQGDEIISGMLAELGRVDLPKPKCRKRRRHWSEDNGGEVDYDRLRIGQPFWRESRREQHTGSQFVTIVVDLGANCGVKADKILWRGAAAVVLAKLLEEAGYRVELWGCFRASGMYHVGPRDIFSAVCLKRPQEPLDIQSLTIAVSGWFFRTVGFRSFCVASRGTDSCLGSHRIPEDACLDEITPDAKRITIHSVWAKDAAIELVRQTVAAIDGRVLAGDPAAA